MISTRYYKYVENSEPKRIRTVIDRLGRLIAAEEWSKQLNPTQWTALSYLAQANRFSRSPSQVAEYMSATRGTVSQTLKTLARKGLIREMRSEADKRSISYTVTDAGANIFAKTGALDESIGQLPPEDQESVLRGLTLLLRQSLSDRGNRAFGICRTCRHHRSEAKGGFCKLLGERLNEHEVSQICHEHSEAT